MPAARVAVIGAGAWGINYVRVLATEPACVLVSVADPDDAALENVRAMCPGVRLLRDPDELLADPSIEAVVIATPAATHSALARAAFGVGKHALIEKPFALDISSARLAAEACAAAGRVGMVGHLMVYHPGFAKLHDSLRGGELGRLRYVHSARANLGRARIDESALWSFGPHDLSMIERLVDEPPESISARGLCITVPTVEDVVFVTLKYASGLMAHVHLSRISPRKERRLSLVCSHRVAEFDDTSQEKIRIYDKAYDAPPTFTQFAQFLTIRDGEVRIPRISMDEPLRLQVRHFLDCIRTGTTPVTDCAHGVRIVSMLAAAERSLRLDGTPVVP